jgi:hypothetical protein
MSTNRTKMDIDLREIESLHLDLWAEAECRHSDRDMPGGDAMNMIGPVANLEAWEHRYEAAETAAMSEDATLPTYIRDQLDTEAHPLLVLATWEDLIREERNQPTDLKASVPRAIAYIRGSLDWAFRTNSFGEQEWLAVDALARDLKAVRSGIESVLHDGIRTDRGADCLTCFQPLVHEWVGDHDNPKTLEDDKWVCRTCEEVSTFAQYLKALENEYMWRATWLSADYVLMAYRIPVGTLQGWASKGHVRKRRNVHTGRMTYHVPEAVKRRDARDTAA